MPVIRHASPTSPPLLGARHSLPPDRRLAALVLLWSLAFAIAACAEEGASPGSDSTVAAIAEDSSAGGAAGAAGAAGGAGGAVAVIRAYYAAIGDSSYGEAYHYWASGGAASKRTPEEFARGFVDTRSVRVRTGSAGRIEGAAGSRYIEIPVTVDAVTSAGAHQRFSGSYVLRRAVVPGATPEQRSWRIYTATLQRSPQGGGRAGQTATQDTDNARLLVCVLPDGCPPPPGSTPALPPDSQTSPHE